MNELTASQESSDSQPSDTEPRFGAVDIVEAFTAMRHEYRGQTKESRALAEQIQLVAANLQLLESKLLARINEIRPDATEIKQLVMIIAETDHQLSRAIVAIEQGEVIRRQHEADEMTVIEGVFTGMSRMARWFARPLFSAIVERRKLFDSPGSGSPVSDTPVSGSPAVEGLNIVLSRLRRLMREQSIERIDVLGQPFDANIMLAIGAVESSSYPAGHVAEQLSPAYRWQGTILRFADVRVAK